MRLDPSVKIVSYSVSSFHHERGTQDSGGHWDRHEEPSVCPSAFDQQYRKFKERWNLQDNQQVTKEQADRAHRW